jgi:hypothetical protein
VQRKKVLIVFALIAVTTACDRFRSAPQMVVADGDTYFVCRDVVWMSSEGGGILGGNTTFKVSFTDASGIDRLLRGVNKLSVSDLPKLPERMPAVLPYPGGVDTSGVQFRAGIPYTWPDGSKAMLSNGKWVPVMSDRSACPG